MHEFKLNHAQTHTHKTRIMLEHTSGGASMKRRRKGGGEKRRENKKEEKKGDR